MKNLYFAKRNISVIAKIVCLSVNFVQRKIAGVTRKVITWSVIIACALIVLMPSALCHASFVKLIRHAIDCIFSCYGSLSIRTEVVPFLFYLYPAAGKYAYFGIIPFSFYLNESGIFTLILAVVAEVVINTVNCIDTDYFLTVYIVVIAVPAVCYRNTVNIGFAVCPNAVEQSVTTSALKHAVNDFIAMSCCGNGRAPVNNGVADFAVGSACVACFCASRCFVGKSIRGVFVPGCYSCSAILIALVDSDISVSTHCFAVNLNQG